ncbi:MAG: hypothetical protein H6618_03145 [Deltaproteobacteria bacterium]|nr:hypothetical protein [Deltaproteobacteria bacterium]
MKVEHIDMIQASAMDVFLIVRDKLPELSRFLPNISEVKQISREEQPDGMQKIVNHWFADVELPSLIRAFLSKSLLSWKDTAVWNEKDLTVSYQLESFVVNDLFRAEGKNVFEDCGDEGTRLSLCCSVEIIPEKIPGVPVFLMKKVNPVIEKVIEKMLQPNLTSLGKGLRDYLREHPLPPR